MDKTAPTPAPPLHRAWSLCIRTLVPGPCPVVRTMWGGPGVCPWGNDIRLCKGGGDTPQASCMPAWSRGGRWGGEDLISWTQRMPE